MPIHHLLISNWQCTTMHLRINSPNLNPKLIIDVDILESQPKLISISEIRSLHLHHRKPIDLLFLSDIRYQECHLNFQQLCVIDDEVKTVAAGRWGENKLIVCCTFHYEYFLEPVGLHNAVDFAFLIILICIEIWGKLHFLHKNRQWKSLMRMRMQHFRLKHWFDEGRLWDFVDYAV